MLLESLVYAASILGAPASSRPFVYEAVALWGRGRRQRKAWKSHTTNTQDIITRTIASVTPCRTVVVLGSGSLFDVPLKALSQAFKTVILVDRVHLAPARLKARLLGNVECQWRELSAASHAAPLGFLQTVPELDWVISVNLVSQLAVGAPGGKERQVIDAHLDGLTTLARPVTLVTDIDYQVLDKAGRITESYDLLYGRPMPASANRWLWDVVPFGEEDRSTRRVHAVAAYPNWTQTFLAN